MGILGVEPVNGVLCAAVSVYLYVSLCVCLPLRTMK